MTSEFNGLSSPTVVADSISAPSADVSISSFWAFMPILRDNIKPSYLQKLSPRPHTSLPSDTACVWQLLSLCLCVWAQLLSHVWLCNPWTIAHQAPLSMGFSRKEYWGGLPFLLQGIFLTQGSNPHFLLLLHWQVDSLPRAPPEKPKMVYKWFLICAGIFLKA